MEICLKYKLHCTSKNNILYAFQMKSCKLNKIGFQNKICRKILFASFMYNFKKLYNLINFQQYGIKLSVISIYSKWN